MSTQVSKNIYAMLEEAMELGELDNVVVTFEYGEKKIQARIMVDEIKCSKSHHSTLSMKSGILRSEYDVDIDRIASVKSE